jgi:UDP-N-acetylmuramoyl-L-alanyl-D-glutamate--2,6-diaminopimelate ligase
LGKGLDLRAVLDRDAASAPAGITVLGLAADSRRVKPGDLFFALAGSKTDGRKFLAAAVERGAIALVAEGARPDDLPGSVPYITVADARAALARAGARFYARQPGTVVAVTGTNGKTSVAAFARQIWTGRGYAAASLGTVGLVAPSGEVAANLTTPDPLLLHRLMDKLAGEGVTHLAMEASSHGLEQRRLDGVRLAAGAFTNLTRDHLDYHRTFEAYRAAKLRLFDTLLPAGAAAVIDADQPEAALVAGIAKRRKLRLVGIGRAGADLTLLDSTRDGFAQLLRIRAAGRERQVKLPLVGAFQVANALVAAGLATATGVAIEDALAALESLKGASGRLELVGDKNGAPIFVDYAHTPDALANALAALRPYAAGRLLVVFGAGGDRDAGKRPLMGAAAVTGADRVIVTDDNPRSEDRNRRSRRGDQRGRR